MISQEENSQLVAYGNFNLCCGFLFTTLMTTLKFISRSIYGLSRAMPVVLYRNLKNYKYFRKGIFCQFILGNAGLVGIEKEVDLFKR